MSDDADASVASSVAALEPLLRSFKEALTESGLPPKEMDELFVTAAEIYALAYRDGIRHAVGEIAPEAERHGLRLWLSPISRSPPPAPGSSSVRTARRVFAAVIGGNFSPTTGTDTCRGGR